MRRARSPFDPPLDLAIGRSGPLLAAVIAAHAFFLLPAAWLALRVPPAIPLLLLPPAAAVFAWRRLTQRSPRAIARLTWEGGRDWRWRRVDGSTGRGHVGAASVRWPGFAALRLEDRASRRTESLLLTPGRVGTAAFRRLGARLRLAPA
ncbi:hypothetical protein PC39_09645 [Salinisphaera sp. PC39]|uniref:protein YgfX n=1 Tax=Salinisphaera sp. PC39 TaxID=1304156 RepID=UPI003342AC91